MSTRPFAGYWTVQGEPFAREEMMKAYGFADPELLTLLSSVLEEWCVECRYDADSREREEAARELARALDAGANTRGELRARLSAATYLNA